MYDHKLRIIAVSSILVAFTVIFTILFPLPIPGGFLFLGDLFIYIAAFLLPKPYAMTVGAIGGVLSDLLLSFSVYVPFTLVIKPLLVVAFTPDKDRCFLKRNIIAPIIGLLITVCGYFVADLFIYGMAAAPIAIPFNALQSAIAGVLCLLTAAAIDKFRLKARLQLRDLR